MARPSGAQPTLSPDRARAEKIECPGAQNDLARSGYALRRLRAMHAGLTTLDFLDRDCLSRVAPRLI
jgi:hypothetical protein